MRIFLSYNFHDALFVREIAHRVGYYLGKQKEVEVYLWSDAAKPGKWADQLKLELEKCDTGVIFISSTIGETQRQEIGALAKLDNVVVATLVPDSELPEKHVGMEDWSTWTTVPFDSCRGDPVKYAKEILNILDVGWVAPDGLPIDYPFDYERDIIKEYRNGQGRISDDFVKLGAPTTWPWVFRDEARLRNPVFREASRGRGIDGEAIDSIIVDAHCPVALQKGSARLRRLESCSSSGKRASPRKWCGMAMM